MLTEEPAIGYGTEYPVWITPKGNLGKIQAQQFFEIGLQAVDPTGQPDGLDVNYELIAGKLPAGIQIDSSGQVTGNPKSTYSIDGVPQAVTQDRTSEFTVRAYSSSGKITDRSFSITVTGNYPPTLLTSNYQPLGEFVDGIIISIPLSAVDENNDTLTYTLINGTLPLGTELSTNGVISGPLVPNYVPPNGWDNDNAPWDYQPFDQTDLLLSPGQSYSGLGKINYYFTIQVSDGKSFDIRNYTITVYNHNAITADSTIIIDDDTDFTSDLTNDRRPILLTTSLGDYETFTSGNFFAFKFEGIDYDNVNVGYSVVATGNSGWDVDTAPWDSVPWDQSTYALPPGLTLDSTTGWLTGYIEPQSYVSQTYTFAVECYSVIDQTITSDYRVFNVTILGALSLTVDWNTDSDLGSVFTGDVSQLVVSATAASGRTLYYSLASGSRIPQGLQLLNDGTISGRVSFQQFSLDKDTTTFDVDNTANGVTDAPTTIDRTYTLIVDATDYSQEISGQKTFTLKVKSSTYEPYDDLYLVCLPSVEKRNILTQILGNTDYFKAEDIYRPNDPYWGVQTDIKVLVGYGLTSSEASAYISAMQTRHYNKKFYFDGYKYARATDADGNALYDVIYVDLVEDTKTYTDTNGYLTPNIPQSSFLIQDGRRLYPNDLTLMNDDLVVAIGETNTNTLPQWETSIQSNGRILGFKTAAVLAYLKPGTGPRVLYLLENNVPQDIKLIPFVADRYIFDNNLDINFDIATGFFITKQYTTFDTGYILSVTPAATVAYALDIPFDKVDGATIAQINDLGGMDGDASGDWNDRLIVFSTQENYDPTEFPILYNDGWNQDGSVIPGYAQVQAGTASVNKRGGVWRIAVANRTVTLTFEQEIALNDVVVVQFGAKAGETWQYSSANIGVDGQTVPKYEQGNFATLQLKSPTTFDGTHTKFINNQDQYLLPFESDSYLKFPLQNIIETAT